MITWTVKVCVRRLFRNTPSFSADRRVGMRVWSTLMGMTTGNPPLG